MSGYGPPEKVYVELHWHDGPREGVANIRSVPHRFKSLFDKSENDDLGTFWVFPIDMQSLALEIEQWHIFVEWNTEYEAGIATADTHPGRGGINVQWDQIETLLEKSRTSISLDAWKTQAKLVRIHRDKRYDKNGPDYLLRWRID